MYNSKFKKLVAGSWKLEAGFTLVELMIVVSILGILAAIVLPEFQGHIQKSKEATAKANLKILRDTIERYAAEHNGVPPGYLNNNPTMLPTYDVLTSQLVGSNLYLTAIPKNPFSNKDRVNLFSNNVAAMVENPMLVAVYGWLYHPKTKTIRLNWSGTDSEGKKYFDY